MKKLLFFLIVSIFLNASELKVAAAANISYPLNELKAKFEELYPNIKLVVNTGASGGFFSQIKNGAEFDIFMAANMDFVKNLEDFTNNKSTPYAKGKLMLFSPKQKASLDALKNAECIAIANPKTAPYGKAATEVLAKIENSGKIIQATSIAATLSQTLSACDLGFIAASSKQEIKALGYKDENMLIVSDDLYEPILQGMIITSKNPDAKVFYDFILSPDAKAIFEKYGYE